MNKYEEVLKRLDGAECLMDIVNAMTLARKWYDSGEIDHDNFVSLQAVGEMMKTDWPNIGKAQS